MRRRQGRQARRSPSWRPTSIRVLEPHFRAARQTRRHRRAPSSTRACSCSASRPRRGGCRSCPPGSGLGLRPDPGRPRPADGALAVPGPDGGDGEELVAQPAIHLDAALVHLNVGDERGNAAFTGPDLYFDDLLLEAADRSGSCRSERHRAHRGAGGRGGRRHPPADQPPARRRRGRGAQRRPPHVVRPRLRPRRGVPEGVPRHRQGPRAVGRRSAATWLVVRQPKPTYQAALAARPAEETARERHRPDRRSCAGPTSARWPWPTASAATARSSPTRSAPSR